MLKTLQGAPRAACLSVAAVAAGVCIDALHPPDFALYAGLVVSWVVAFLSAWVVGCRRLDYLRLKRTVERSGPHLRQHILRSASKHCRTHGRQRVLQLVEKDTKNRVGRTVTGVAGLLLTEFGLAFATAIAESLLPPRVEVPTLTTWVEETFTTLKLR